MPAVEAALHRVDEGARDAAERAGQVRTQAAQRSREAANALRGRPRRPPPWQWLAAALAAGAVIGAAGALAARRAKIWMSLSWVLVVSVSIRRAFGLPRAAG